MATTAAAESFLKRLCEDYTSRNVIDPKYYDNFRVKRGLRNRDGTGVMAGLTLIGNVHGYILSEGDVVPQPGVLTYRGYDVRELVDTCRREDRFAFEETAYLLLFGGLPDREQLERFSGLLAQNRELPEHFTEDIIIRTPSPNIMNKLGQSILALYPYDDRAEDMSVENQMRQAIELIAKLPTIVARAWQVCQYHYNHRSMAIHFTKEGLSAAESFLHTMRSDNAFTELEARALDRALVLHAEHGGGNNSAFTCRTLSSAGSDMYSALSAAVGSLKGSKHGGANLKVRAMVRDIEAHVRDLRDDEELSAYLGRILRREAGDGSGLLYGFGHAVYTLSDPRAEILRDDVRALAAEQGHAERFEFLARLERLAPEAVYARRGRDKHICANVDFYSGFLYELLRIPEELYTPLFAIARVTGWCAHRIEELTTGGRIIRPAYKNVAKPRPFTPLDER